MRRLALTALLALSAQSCVGPLRALDVRRDRMAERWCAAVQEGAAIYGEFSGDLDAQAFVAPAREAPPMSSFGDRGPVVRDWQEHLESHGISPGPIDGIHGEQTERATEAWLRSVSPETRRTAAPWAASYAQAKGIVEALRAGLLALCQTLDEGEAVSRADLLDKGFAPAAEAFGDVVEIHRDVTTQPPAPGQPLLQLSRSVKVYDHQAILDELRLVQSEAIAAQARD